MANRIPLTIVAGINQALASADLVHADGIAPRSGTTLSLGADATTTVINMNGVAVTTINIGNASTQVNIPGTLTVSTTATMDGDTAIGDNISDSLTVTAGILGNLTFRKEANHLLLVEASTTLNAAGGEIGLQGGAGTGTGNGGDVTLTGGTSVSGIPGSVSVVSTRTVATQGAALTITQDGTPAGIFVGTVDPSAGGGVVATEGSLFLRDAGASGSLWIKTGAANTAWSSVGTGGPDSLQTAYDTGNTISVVSATGTIDFSNSTDATNVLTVSRTFAGGGVGVNVSMGASTTGVGVQVTSNASATGAGIAVSQLSTTANGIEVAKGSGGASSGNGVYIDYQNASSTGDGLVVDQEGQGDGIQVNLASGSTGRGIFLSGVSGSTGTLAVASQLSATANGVEVTLGSGGAASGTGIFVDYQSAASSGPGIEIDQEGTGPGLLVAMGAGSAGNGITVTTNASASGVGVRITHAGTGNAFQTSVDGNDIAIITASGAFNVSAQAASTIQTIVGALTLTSVASATWSSSGGSLTVEGNQDLYLSAGGDIMVTLQAALDTVLITPPVNGGIQGITDNGPTSFTGANGGTVSVTTTSSGAAGGNATFGTTATGFAGGDAFFGAIAPSGTSGGAVLQAGGVSYPNPSSGQLIVDSSAGTNIQYQTNDRIVVSNDVIVTPASGSNFGVVGTGTGNASITTVQGTIDIAGSSGASAGGNVTVAAKSSSGTSGSLILSTEATGAGTAGDLQVITTAGNTGTVGDILIASYSSNATTRGGISIRTGNAAPAAPAADQILIVANNGAGTADITFQARGSTSIPLNESGDVDLDPGFTATSIIGAINELYTGAGSAPAEIVQTGFDTTTNSLADGDLGYLTTTANRVQKAIATSIAASAVFGANEGTAGAMTTHGTIENQNVESTITVTAGDRLYLSASEAGKVTNVAPSTTGQVVMPVGYARTSNGGAGNDVALLLLIGTPVLL